MRTKINKIINTHAIITVHICTVTIAIVHKCTIMHKLVWVFFCSNCVKVVSFSILHNYAQADVIALSLLLLEGKLAVVPVVYIYIYIYVHDCISDSIQ